MIYQRLNLFCENSYLNTFYTSLLVIILFRFMLLFIFICFFYYLYYKIFYYDLKMLKVLKIQWMLKLDRLPQPLLLDILISRILYSMISYMMRITIIICIHISIWIWYRLQFFTCMSYKLFSSYTIL